MVIRNPVIKAERLQFRIIITMDGRQFLDMVVDRSRIILPAYWMVVLEAKEPFQSLDGHLMKMIIITVS